MLAMDTNGNSDPYIKSYLFWGFEKGPKFKGKVHKRTVRVFRHKSTLKE